MVSSCKNDIIPITICYVNNCEKYTFYHTPHQSGLLKLKQDNLLEIEVIACEVQLVTYPLQEEMACVHVLTIKIIDTTLNVTYFLLKKMVLLLFVVRIEHFSFLFLTILYYNSFM